MKNIMLIATILGIFSAAMAQKPVKVCGEYTYYAPENVNTAHAKQTALQRARLAGLIQEFNQIVYQSNTTVTTNRDGESSVDLYSFGGSDARGEWIEDTEEPRYTISYEQDMLVVKAEVCGKAREIKSAGIIIESKVLRNGTAPRFESDKFVSGDDMYLWFRSPVDGWLTVYLLDRNSKTVYCLLPYRNSPMGAVEIKHDQTYVFFQQDRILKDWQYIDEYTLTAESSVEWNEVYVVFSPNHYAKAIGNASGKIAPHEMPLKDFVKWLEHCRTKDKDMTVNKHLLEIRNTK